MGSGAIALPGCASIGGSGVIEELTYEVEHQSITRLSVCCGFEVHVEQGTSDQVSLRGDDNLIPEVVVGVEGSTLEVRWYDEKAVYRPSQPMVVELEVPELEDLQVSGGAHVEFGPVATAAIVISNSGGSTTRFESLDATDVELDVSGGGFFTIQSLAADSVSLLSSGGATVELTGTSPAFGADVSGGGVLEVRALDVTDAHVLLSGGSTAELQVSGELTGDFSGGSSAVVSGGASVDVVLSGGSTLTEQ